MMATQTGKFRVIEFATLEDRSGYHNCAPFRILSTHRDFSGADVAAKTARENLRTMGKSVALIAIEELAAETTKLW